MNKEAGNIELLLQHGFAAHETGDYAKAAEWFSKAAEQENAQAQFELGVLYEKGQGVPQDCAKAAEWYGKAAAQGHAMAQIPMLINGIGQAASKDDVMTAESFSKTAADVRPRVHLEQEEVEHLLAKLAELDLEEEKDRMYDLIGKKITPQNGKNYLAVSMRQIGEKYLYLLVAIEEPLEMIIGDIWLSDGKFLIMEYTGSDYAEILTDFLNTVLTDLQNITAKPE